MTSAAIAAADRPAADTADPAEKIRIRGLDFYYGDFRALKTISMPVYERQVSIYENIAFGIRLYDRLPRSGLDERVESALRRAALWDEVKDKLGANGLSLSGGQQQRLCIARTIAVHPEVILLDEPCSALDPISTARIEELIDELKDDYTIVIVTHNMQQAGRCSNYTAFFYLGRLIEFGPTSKIFSNPSERQTEDYITGRFG